MENNGILGTIITVVVAFVILSVVLVPVVDSESSYYVERDENNENPLSDIRLTYTEQPVSKTYEIYWNNNSSPGIFRISGDFTYSGSLGTNQILMGTDNWNISVYEGTIRESIDGKSSFLITLGFGTFTRTITNGIVEGTSEPYKYLYYPDEFGIYANYDSYEYNTADAYSVGSFAGMSVITKGGEIQSNALVPMVADTLTEDGEYTGMDFYPAPPEPELEETEPQDEEIVESLSPLGNIVEYPDSEWETVKGNTANANTNPSNSTLVGDLWYSLGDVNTINYALNGGAMVTGVRDANLSAIVIPSTVTLNGNTYDVVGVANNSFQSMTSLLSVTIPDSLRYFGGLNSFGGASTDTSSGQVCYGCTSLSSFIFSLSSNLEVLGGSTFYNAKLLNLTSLPATLKRIGSSCFSGCELINLDIPSSVEVVGGYAFKGCKALTQITWPSSVTTIGGYTFSGCTSLTSISLPDTITSIGGYAFSNCPLLQLSTLPSSLTTIGAYAFQTCTSITISSFPVNVSSIGAYAFNGCTNVTFSALPMLTTISTSTFRNCANITISSIPNTVTNIENLAFFGCTSITYLNIPSSVIAIGDEAFNGCTNLVIAELPVNLTSLGRLAFKNCANITITTIPNGITTLPEGVFYGCTSIVTMDLNNVSTIGYYSSNGAFHGCTGLISVTGLNVRELGTYTTQYNRVDVSSAFSNCTSLATVNMPNLTAIGSSAFYNCASLLSLNLPNVEYVVGSNCFSNCTSLTTLFMPSLETIYGSYVTTSNTFCSGCTNLTTVTIPKVTALTATAFRDCTNLRDLTIGTLAQVGTSVFQNTPNLAITIDCSDCTEIRNTSFRNSGIIGIKFGEGLTTIGTEAFERCKNLVITKDDPIYAVTIGLEAFNECSSILSISLPNIETITASNQFGYCTSLTEIVAPNLVTISNGSLSSNVFGYSGLVIADMPKLETIGNYAFANTKIKDTTSIMKSAITVGNYVFYQCVDLSILKIGKNVETVGTQQLSFFKNVAIIVEGSPTMANAWVGTGSVPWDGPGIVILGNPTFQGNWFSSSPSNGTHIDVLNYGETTIAPGMYGLPQSTVVRTDFEDVAMLQVAEHVGLYKEYKTEIEYVLLMILPPMLALGIVVAILYPRIRDKF